MKKVICLFFIVFLSCKETCLNISKSYENNIWLPNTYEVIDCKIKKDFLTDGGKEELIIIRIQNKDVDDFIKKNNLNVIKKDKSWDYAPQAFYERILLENELKVPENIKTEEVYYKFEGINKYSLECIFETHTGYFIGNLGS